MRNQRRVIPKPFHADSIADTEYDLFIATTGFESRAIWVAENLCVSAVEFWAPAFANRQSLQFEHNNQFFKSRGYDTEVCRESDFYNELVKRLVKHAARMNQGEVLHIAVDISSMSRLRMASIVDAVRFAKFDQEVQCDFIYSLAEFSEPENENHPISEFGPVTDEFAGWSDDPSKSCSVLFGAGYEQDQIIGVVEMLEADDVWVFVPHGPDERYYTSVLEGNQALWDVVPENRRLDYSVMRPFDTFSAIESLLYGKLASTRPMIVPFGPKIFSVVSMIAAAIHQPEVAIWRVSTGQSDTPMDRKGTEHLSSIRMVSSVLSGIPSESQQLNFLVGK